MNNTLTTRRWRWIGDVLRKTNDSIYKTAVRWISVGKKKTRTTPNDVEEDS